MPYNYYRLLAKNKPIESPLYPEYHSVIFSPRISKLNLHTGLKPLYIFWYILTLGKYQIYYVYDKSGQIIHYSHIMPKIYKYAFMPRKNSLHIGPCWTSSSSRGKGVYPAILSKICKDHNNKNIYIFTDQNNIPSQKGIDKVGFQLFSNGIKTKLFGIYKERKDINS